MEFVTASSGIESPDPDAQRPPGVPRSIATLTFTRNAAARGVNLILETTQDLSNWTPLATSVNGAVPTGGATINETSGTIRTVTVSQPAANSMNCYRLRAEMP